LPPALLVIVAPSALNEMKRPRVAPLVKPEVPAFLESLNCSVRLFPIVAAPAVLVPLKVTVPPV
jgi:hypothetical protein